MPTDSLGSAVLTAAPSWAIPWSMDWSWRSTSPSMYGHSTAPRAKSRVISRPDIYLLRISICSAGYPPPIIKRGNPSPKLLAAPEPGSDKQRQVIRACSGQHFGTQANVWCGNAVIDWLDRPARRIRRLGRIWAHSERVIITQPGGCRGVEVAAN